MEAPLKELFKAHFGAPTQSVAALKGDGSARKLFRLSGAGKTAVGVLGADLKENQAFLGFSRHFRAQGLPVPEIYAEDLDRGAYLEEDLGDTTLFAHLSEGRKGEAVGAETVEVYRRVVAALPRFQVQAGKTLDYALCYPRASFDRQSMTWDLNHFKYYFLRLSKLPFDEQALEDDFSRLLDFLLSAPRDFFLYRDFQSRNVMVRGGEPWFIDYQGGRKGALQYDIASLLYDAKADLPFELREELLERYLEAVGKCLAVDRGEFMRYFPGYVYIRIMQALGTYGLRGFYERKTHFLQSVPYAVRNVEYLLRHYHLPVPMPALSQVLKRLAASSYLRQLGDAKLPLSVRVQSFSYNDGMPADERGHGGGFVFDCRALPNPGREERFAKLTGHDKPVADFLRKDPAVARFLEHAFALASQSVENYRGRNFSDLMVAFGCTGGRHRSVFCAESLAARLRKDCGVKATVRHRGLESAALSPQ